MKPYPFVGLNHLTVPVATARSIECCPGQIAGRSNLALRVSCRRCPLLAQSGHADCRPECPLLGVKRTSRLCCGADGWPPSTRSSANLFVALRWNSAFQLVGAQWTHQHRISFMWRQGAHCQLASDARRLPCRSSAVCELILPIRTPVD